MLVQLGEAIFGRRFASVPSSGTRVEFDGGVSNGSGDTIFAAAPAKVSQAGDRREQEPSAPFVSRTG